MAKIKVASVPRKFEGPVIAHEFGAVTGKTILTFYFIPSFMMLKKSVDWYELAFVELKKEELTQGDRFIVCTWNIHPLHRPEHEKMRMNAETTSQGYRLQ